MKRVMVMVLLLVGVGVALETRMMPREGYGPPNILKPVYQPSPTATRIDGAPDTRTIMGSAGKNICGDTTGTNVAVLYGYTSGNPDNIFQTKIGYSVSGGRTWALFGPYSLRYTYYRRMYGGIDARPYYWTNNEVTYGIWHEAYYRGGVYAESSITGVAFDEGTFPSGAFQRRIMTCSGDPEHNIWLPCIAVAPDNPNRLVATGGDYNFAQGGCGDIYAWYSTNGGYSWSGWILIVPAPPVGSQDPPHFRFGTGGHGFAYFNRDTLVGGDTLMWPYYVETTDYGQTWTQPKLMQVTPWPPFPRYSLWWYDFDCEVTGSNNPMVVLTPSPPGTHSGRFEFWKGSGSVGNRTWQMKVLVGGSPPGTDTLCTFCSILTGKDFARGRTCIGAAAHMRVGTGTAGPWLWHSTDLGESWRLIGKLADIGAYNDPCEIAHIPGRVPGVPTSAKLHLMYFLTNAVYYDSAIVTNFFLGVEEEAGGRSIEGMSVWPNPATGKITVRLGARQGRSPDRMPSISVYDIAGKKVGAVGASPVNQNELTADLSALPRGTYFLKSHDCQPGYIKKVVVTR